MKLIFRTFNCGAGDCLFMVLKKHIGSYHIMVDCGNLNKEVESFVTTELDKRIDLLVVTHIDNDHIAGLCSLLEKISDLKIGKLLFNCYHRPNNECIKELSEKQLSVLNHLKMRLPVALVNKDGKVSALKAISLSEKILGNESWSKAWNRVPVFAGMNIDLNEYGKITILSPRQADLDLLESQFKKEFWAKFFKNISEAYNKDEELYEVLLRIWERTLVEQRNSKVSYTRLTKDNFERAAKNQVLPVTLPNKCSIAFMYEYKEHRLLLLGDADPEIVLEAIVKFIDGEEPYLIDLVKVSHHGSAHNTTESLVGMIDACHYYFTGGNKEDRPSLEALSRIITSPLKTQKQRILHFNRKNRVLEELCKMPGLADYPCVIDLENIPYEVEL